MSICECAICLDNIEKNINMVTTECGHVFHTNCLLNSIANKSYNCPLCRNQLADKPKEDDESEYFDEEDEEDDEEDKEDILEFYELFKCNNNNIDYENISYYNSDYILRGFRMFSNFILKKRAQREDLIDEEKHYKICYNFGLNNDVPSSYKKEVQKMFDKRINCMTSEINSKHYSYNDLVKILVYTKLKNKCKTYVFKDLDDSIIKNEKYISNVINELLCNSPVFMNDDGNDLFDLNSDSEDENEEDQNREYRERRDRQGQDSEIEEIEELHLVNIRRRMHSRNIMS
jgi:hypothetical protein